MLYKDKADRAVAAYLSSKTTRWQLGNQVLYDLCKKHPSHNDADEIVAKIWLIGRSYAAAIERRRNAESLSGDFYYDVVAPAILSVGEELDDGIQCLKMCQWLNDDTLDAVLDIHGHLTKTFEKLTNMDKRSLASKYLHFHCPDMFFIYDSRASSAINKLVNKGKENLYKHISAERDMVYTDFCVRAVELRSYIDSSHGIKLTPRELDDLLLYNSDN